MNRKVFNHINTVYNWADAQGNKVVKMGDKFEIVEKSQPQPMQKEGIMYLTVGTWLCIIIVCFLVAKIAYRVTLKTVFRPTKRILKNIKAGWDEA